MTNAPSEQKEAPSVTPTKVYSPTAVVPPKKIGKPIGEFRSANVGINSILNPVSKVNATAEEQVNHTKSENNSFSIEELDYAWKSFVLKLKREKKNSLFSTLNGANHRLGSDFTITIDLNNTNQVKEVDLIKPAFISFLRKKLRNTKINISYNMIEAKKASFTDNKSVFEDLSKENQSLIKFRKMFNLDIDF